MTSTISEPVSPTPAAPTDINTLINITNSHIVHLHTDHEYISARIQELELEKRQQEEFAVQLEQQLREEAQRCAQIQQSFWESQSYQLSPEAIKQRNEYIQGQFEAQRIQQEDANAKRNHWLAKQEYIKDQLEELRERQRLLEVERLKAELLLSQQKEQALMEQVKQQQLLLEQQQKQQQQQQQQQQFQQPPSPPQQAFHQQPQTYQPHQKHVTNPSRSRVNTSPTQRLRAQEESIGLDAKLIHFYAYHYIFINLCNLHRRNPSPGNDFFTNSDSDLITSLSLWSYQATNASDFPSRIFSHLESSRSKNKGLFDPQNQSEIQAMTHHQKLRLVSQSSFPLPSTTAHVNNLYSLLSTNIDFFSQFNQNHQDFPFIQSLLTDSTFNSITKLQSIVDFSQIQTTIESILTPSVNKLSKTYSSILETIDRFGGLVHCTMSGQPPSTIQPQTIHPSLTLLLMIKFQSQLLDSTNDWYLIGMTTTCLSQLTPFFHYLFLSTLLHCHQHSTPRDLPHTPALKTFSPTNLTYPSRTHTCTLPSCQFSVKTAPSNHATAPETVKIDVVTSRVRLITAYSQSILPENIVSEIPKLNRDLANLRRNVPHPRTTPQALRQFLDVLHLDFSKFTNQFGYKISQLQIQSTQQPSADKTQLYNLSRKTVWELCNCCGFKTISPANYKPSPPAPSTITSDPHWDHSKLINKPQTMKIIQTTAAKIGKQTSDDVKSIDEDLLIFPYPTLYPFSSFSTPPQNPLTQTLYPTNPSAVGNDTGFDLQEPLPVIKIGNKMRLDFLWAWFGQLLNTKITPAYIHYLLPSLQVAGFQLRYTFAQVGHTLLQFIYDQIVMQKSLLTTATDTQTNPPTTKSVNITDYVVLKGDFETYFDQNAYPFSETDKVISDYQSSNNALEVITQEDYKKRE
jgi:hypothetical protein